jgi:hypothetical protein
MTFEDKRQDVEDAQVEVALRHFRESVHGWSEQEYARPRVVAAARPGAFWRVAGRPVTLWATAALVAVSVATVPVTKYRQHERLVANAVRHAQEEKAKHEEALRQAELAINDEDLLSHVDSDIAQSTPDAMEPLASLMNETK